VYRIYFAEPIGDSGEELKSLLAVFPDGAEITSALNKFRRKAERMGWQGRLVVEDEGEAAVSMTAGGLPTGWRRK
jgi:hypothetical protein